MGQTFLSVQGGRPRPPRRLKACATLERRRGCHVTAGFAVSSCENRSKANCLEPLGLNVTEAANVLGVARHTLSRVLNGHAAISPEMAIRLGKAGWSTAEFWLRRQTAYDLVQARKTADRIKVQRYRPQLVSGFRQAPD